jgi:N-acetyl-anhydromuramyl-L-alanine amidase AmpD
MSNDSLKFKTKDTKIIKKEFKKYEKSTGREVKAEAYADNVDLEEIQNTLISLGYDVKATDKFDDATKAAIKAFQKKSKLEVDGIIGPKTLAALKKKGKSIKPKEEKKVSESNCLDFDTWVRFNF